LLLFWFALYRDGTEREKKKGCALSSSGGTNERTNDLGGMTRLCCGSNTLDDKDADTEKNKKYDQVFLGCIPLFHCVLVERDVGYCAIGLLYGLVYPYNSEWETWLPRSFEPTLAFLFFLAEYLLSFCNKTP